MKKISKYNTTIRISSQYGICYNAVSDKFVLLKSQAYDEMCDGNIENIKQHYPDLYEQLDAVRAIVDCGVDEVRQVHDVIMRINYTADNISSMSSIVDEFVDLEQQYRNLIAVDFQRVWQDIDKAADEDAVDTEVYNCIKYFHENGFKVSCAKTSNNVQSTCYGSMRNYALVNYNGDVYQCTARDFNKANRYGWLTETGGLVYENGLKEKRESARFSKKVCHDCRIAPVCGGGCAQKAMELYDATDCVFGYTEEGIRDFVLDRFEYSLLLGEMNGDKCIICR